MLSKARSKSVVMIHDREDIRLDSFEEKCALTPKIARDKIPNRKFNAFYNMLGFIELYIAACQKSL
jgi:hypothetical protein